MYLFPWIKNFLNKFVFSFFDYQAISWYSYIYGHRLYYPSYGEF